jgi:hypothetical protein
MIYDQLPVGYIHLRRKRRREVFRACKMDVAGWTGYVVLLHTLLCLTRIRCFDICPQLQTQPKLRYNGNMDRTNRQLVMRTSTSGNNSNNNHIYNHGRTWPERPYLLPTSTRSSTAGVTLSTRNDHSTVSRFYNSNAFPSSNSGTTTTTATATRRTSPRPIQKRRRRQKMKPMPILGYSARTILAYYDARPLEVGWRLNSLGFPLLGMYSEYIVFACIHTIVWFNLKYHDSLV